MFQSENGLEINFLVICWFTAKPSNNPWFITRICISRKSPTVIFLSILSNLQNFLVVGTQVIGKNTPIYTGAFTHVFLRQKSLQ
jgi:hypothetical protein